VTLILELFQSNAHAKQRRGFMKAKDFDKKFDNNKEDIIDDLKLDRKSIV